MHTKFNLKENLIGEIIFNTGSSSVKKIVNSCDITQIILQSNFPCITYYRKFRNYHHDTIY